MAKPVLDERMVYISLRCVFTGPNTGASKIKAIRKLIQRHQHVEAVSELLQNEDLEDVCTVAKRLLDEGVFRPGWLASARFPGVSQEPTKPKPPSKPEVTSTLCGKCKRIDFDKIFRTNLEYDQGALVAHLGRNAPAWNESPCPLCRLFAAVKPPYPHHGPESTKPCAEHSYCLWAFPAFTLLDVHGASPVESSEIANNVVLGVFCEKDAANGTIRDVQLEDKPDYICNVLKRNEDHVPAINGRCLDAVKIDYSVLREWFQYCEDRHGESSLCGGRGSSGEIPFFQVIDCGTRRVIEPPTGIRFSALSYVWGVKDDVPDAMDEHGALRVGALPKVVEDAITATTAMGLHYLWVDKYCIAQNDPKIQHLQILHMGDVYKAAYITIIASASDDSSYGLPGVGSRPRDITPPVTIGNRTLTRTSLTRANFQRHLQGSNWVDRAWTYQELLFSRRRLFFTDIGVYFECAGMWTSEHADEAPAIRSLRNAPNPGFPQLGAEQAELEETQLIQCIQEYSRRKLTFESDKLNAVLGILQAFGEVPRPIHHYLGVPVLGKTDSGNFVRSWIHGFLEGLCWQVILPSTRRDGFPSWSWTGWRFSVTFPSGSPSSDVPPSAANINFSSDVNIWAELNNGSLIEWSGADDFAAFNAKLPSLSRFIHIEAWTIELQFEDSGNSIGHLRERPATLRDSDSHEPYFTTFRSGTGDRLGRPRPGLDGDFQMVFDVSGKGKAYIPLRLTRDVREYPGFQERLLTDTWTGILIGDASSPQILVLDRERDAVERVGIIEFNPWTSRFRPRMGANLKCRWRQNARDYDAGPISEIGAQAGGCQGKLGLRMRLLEEVTGLTEQERQHGTPQWADVMASLCSLQRTKRQLRLG